MIRRQQVTGSICASYVRVSELQAIDHMVAQFVTFGQSPGVRSGMILIKAQGKKWLSGIEPSPSFPRSFSGNPGCAKLLDSRQEHAGMTDGGIGRTIISCHAP